jgi:hypothetical protein
MGRGALMFKGDTSLPRKKGSTSKSKKRPLPDNAVMSVGTIRDTTLGQTAAATSTTLQCAQEACSVRSQSQPSPQITVGRGKITVSGTVVTGYDTKFSTDVQVGDALLVQNEMRVITMRLSDISLNLSSAFSQSVVTSKPISYSYICKPRDVTKESEIEQRKAEIEKAADIERHQNAFASVITTTNASSAVGSASSTTLDKNNTIVYRERTEHGNYRIKQMKVADGKTITNRSDMLDIRSKKTSDKYC